MTKLKQIPGQSTVMTAILLIMSCIFIMTQGRLYSQGVAINSGGSAAHQSAMLDVSSTNHGILIPRMTEIQKNAILSPAIGLMIYQTDATNGFWYYDGITWVQSIGAAGATGPTGSSSSLPTGTSGQTLRHDGNNWTANDFIYNSGTAVGIGTSIPSTPLEVNGMTKSQKYTATTSGDRLDPAFRFGFDTYNPGIYRNGNDVMGFSAAGQASFFIGPSWAGVAGTQVSGSVFSLHGGSPFITMVPNGAPGTSKMLLLKNQASVDRWSFKYVDEGPPNTGPTRISFTYEPTSAEYLTIRDDGKVGINTITPGSALDVKGQLRLSGSSSGYVGFAVPAAAGSTTYTLPNADGNTGQVLTTNGSGTLSWSSPAGGSPAGVVSLVTADESDNQISVSYSPCGTGTPNGTLKTYSLAANSYSKIIAEAEGYIELGANGGGAFNTGTITITLPGGASESFTARRQISVGGDTGDNGWRFPYRVSVSAAAAAGGNITVTGSLSLQGCTGGGIYVKSLRVFGVN